jgi:hypothetical protein
MSSLESILKDWVELFTALLHTASYNLPSWGRESHFRRGQGCHPIRTSCAGREGLWTSTQVEVSTGAKYPAWMLCYIATFRRACNVMSWTLWFLPSRHDVMVDWALSPIAGKYELWQEGNSGMSTHPVYELDACECTCSSLSWLSTMWATNSKHSNHIVDLKYGRSEIECPSVFLRNIASL